MKLPLKTIEELGYTKISMCYLADKVSFFDMAVRELYMHTLTLKVTAHSMLDYIEIIKPLDSSIGGGVALLLDKFAPLGFQSGKCEDRIAKRDFMRAWRLLWKNYGASRGLSAVDIDMYSSVALKLLIIYNARYLPKSKRSQTAVDLVNKSGIDLEDIHECIDRFEGIFEFFNSVVLWYFYVKLSTEFDIDSTILWQVMIDNKTFGKYLSKGRISDFVRECREYQWRMSEQLGVLW